MSRAVSLELQHSTNRTVFAEKKTARIIALGSAFASSLWRPFTVHVHVHTITHKITAHFPRPTKKKHAITHSKHVRKHTHRQAIFGLFDQISVFEYLSVCVHPRLEGNADCRLPLPFCRRRRSPRESGATLTSSTLSWRNVLRRAYCALPARIRRKTFNCAPRVCSSKHKHTCAMQRCNQLIMDVRKRNQVIFVYELSAVEMHVSERVSRVCVASRRVSSAECRLGRRSINIPTPGDQSPTVSINSFQVQPDNDRKTSDKHN